MRQRGFTLIEVIVAFALFAGALTLLLASLSGASAQVRQADHHGRVALHAQSLFAELGIEAPFQAGQTQGSWDQGTYQWVLSTTPYTDGELRDAAGSGLYQLDLQVSWGPQANQQLRWQTLRMAGPTEAAR